MTKREPKPPARARSEFFKHGIGLFTAIGGFIGAVATLVAVLAGLFAGHGSSSTPSPSGGTSTTSPSHIAYKEVTNRTGTLALEVPRPWVAAANQSVQAGSFGFTFTGPGGLADSAGVGDGLTASSKTVSGVDWAVDQAFIGASRQAAQRLRLASMSPTRALGIVHDRARDADWTLEGCEFSDETRLATHGFTGWLREWTNCGQVGTYYWEFYALPADRSAFVVLQLQTQHLSGLKVLDHILKTFRVEADRVP